MVSGIYSITCIENGKRYIGQSVDIQKRWATHSCALRNGTHVNVHLQRAWDKGNTFRFEILEECGRDELNEREIYWIAYFDSFRNGYNLCEGGNSTKGRTCSTETRRRISEANKGRRFDADAIKRRTESLQNHLKEDPVFAEEYRNKLSEIHKGKPSWNKGKPCPADKKKLLSEKLKGRTITEEHRAKLRELYAGEKSITAKLEKSDIVRIRYRFLCGERQSDICKDYPVTSQTIYDIVRGRRWKSVPNTKEELEVLL